MPDSLPRQPGDLAQDLAAARAARTPRMALRPDPERPNELDDIVVHDVTMFRAEANDYGSWWMACSFANGEEVRFHVGIASKPKRLVFETIATPAEWINIDICGDLDGPRNSLETWS